MPDLAVATDRVKVEFRCDPEWLKRVRRHAKRLELGLSAYIRQAVTRQMEQDDSGNRRTGKRRDEED